MSAPADGSITRIVPVNGLLVDADLWATAHDYHRFHLQRHGLLLHGPGIAGGLEVVAHDPPNRTLVIYPGLAIDPLGNSILLPECERYTIQTDQPGPIFIILQFREVAAGGRGPAGSGVPTHLREAYRIRESRTVPEEPHIELARIWLTGGREPVGDAPNPMMPGPNQVDVRHRVMAGGLARGEIGVGQAWLDAMPAPIHGGLPVRLAQSLALTTDFRARFIGQIPPSEAVGRCALLYLAADGPIPLSGSDVEGLRGFVDGGGTILADSCHADANDPFQATILDLAARLGRALQPVDRANELLREPHLFGAPPPGAAPGGLIAADGLIYSQLDYGCALDGGRVGQALDRATVRAVLEFVTNAAFTAHRRQRTVAFAATRRAP